ncbi:hypothetical protein SAMN04489761_0661 [Tenacibaculum sp. MAR_2009_124]|uniref:hypothetical protein n=1 Tax=Tenacibaculum sp. MAR_2009_124 TaxID=1250059 RepID=UPI000896DE8D|nr:hypothetical protein [Tenacibaculum sp. MAR_2009_124]SEB42958.1 hypothetical protein SAMN04489761_0661 [Tenacibaculum sp. MAR_2009_124]
MKTLKTIFVMLFLIVFTTSCTDLTEDLKLHDKLKKENVNSKLPNTMPMDTGDGDGDGDTDRG